MTILVLLFVLVCKYNFGLYIAFSVYQEEDGDNTISVRNTAKQTTVPWGTHICLSVLETSQNYALA